MTKKIMETCLQFAEARLQAAKPGTAEHMEAHHDIALWRYRLLMLEIGDAGGCPGSITQYPEGAEDNRMALNVSETIVDALLKSLDKRGHIDLFHDDDYLPTRDALVREIGGILTTWTRERNDAETD